MPRKEMTIEHFEQTCWQCMNGIDLFAGVKAYEAMGHH
jgi:hypothetical protein